MNRALVRTLGACAALVLVAACGSDDDDPMAPEPPPGEPGDTRSVLANPSFATNIQEIFGRRGCTAAQCHGADPGQANLNLSSGTARAQLVRIPSRLEPTFLRVVPDSADISYLVIKIEGRQQVGVQMPVGGTLDSIDINNIRNWINQGAQNN